MRNSIVALISCLVLTSACGGGKSSPSTPTTPTTPTPPVQQNRAPVINSMTLSSAFGMSQLTTFSYSASATDPDGDTVTYTWDLAGTPANGASGTVVFNGSGTGTVRVTVSDGRGLTATDSRTVTIASATGTWRGSGASLGTFTMNLQQNGPVVTGTYSDSEGSGQIDPAQPGSVNAQGHLEMRIKQGRYTDWNFKGDIDQSGRRITGQIFGSGFNGQAFTMDKQ
jgi:hypothetical protein